VGNTPGRIFASVLRRARFGKLLALGNAGDQAVNRGAVALRGGGGTVSWGSATNLGAAFSAEIGADGTVGPPQLSSLGIVPFAADGGGDQVLAGPGSVVGEGAWSGGSFVQFGVLMRPAGGGADQPAPSSSGQLAVSAPLGRRVALVWNTSPMGVGDRMALSLWRP
jgi:hypothetical protein